jgi:hypothetical protein
MSETPRTDEREEDCSQERQGDVTTIMHVESGFARELERELAAMTAAKKLAERQVAVLCTRLCVRVDCRCCPAKKEGCGTKCDITTAAWSRAEAEKGGKG